MKQAPPNEEVARYLERIEELYRKIQDEWLPTIDSDAQVTRADEVVLNEELSGPYEAPTIEIRRNGGMDIRFLPRGCYVIAASGRLDVASDLGRETILYLEGQPRIEATITHGDGTEPLSIRHLRRQGGEGWVWVRDTKSGDVPLLDCKTFERLMEVLGE